MVLLARRALLELKFLNTMFLDLQEGYGVSRAGAWMEVSLLASSAARPGVTGAAVPPQSSHSAQVLPQGRQDPSPPLAPDADGAAWSCEQRGSPGLTYLKPRGLDCWPCGGAV